MKTHFGRGLIAAASLTFVLTACDQSALVQDSPAPEETVFDGPVEGGAVIPGRYVVVLKPDAVAGKTPRRVVEQVAAEHGADPTFTYDAAIAGFAAALGQDALSGVRQDRRVAYVEPDRYVQLDPITILGPPCSKFPDRPDCSPGSEDPPTEEPPAADPQDIPWGVARVNGGVTGASGTAWILDTGIDLDHPDLDVDPTRGFSAFTSGRDAKLGLDDGNGHGTHVAGTVAAIDNSIGVIGVAAGATVVPVKVLSHSGSGSYSGVIAGINFVAANGSSGDVANMSLGGGFSQAVNDAVIAAAATGVKFSLAAGNESTDAGTRSPASANHVNIVTISASEQGDIWAYFSNWGNPPVDYAAPGRSILSTWKDGGYNTISGTSMAAPHVAGIMLLGPIGNGGPVSGDPDGNPDTIAVH